MTRSDTRPSRTGKPQARGSKPGATTRQGGRRQPGADKRPASGPRLAPSAIRIQQIQQVLERILTWEYPADMVLSRWLREQPKLGARDRSEVAEAVFDVLRHLRRYRHFAQSAPGDQVQHLAVLGLASVLPEDALLAGVPADTQVWLQHVQQIDTRRLPQAVRWSLPDWLAARLAQLPDAESLVEALNQPAALDVRVNPMKMTRDDLLTLMQELAPRHDPQATPYSPWGVRLQGRPAINRWQVFVQGALEVQDEGSQLLAALVAPKRGEMVIDYCAGAGGKTLLLGALMRSTGRLYAFDVSAARLARAKPRFARSGLSNITPVVIAANNDQRVRRLHGKAHRVLVDAPCSGLGTLRRSPDLKWRQQPDTLQQLLGVQADLLRQAAQCVRPGGRLVYATCSVLPEENQAQVEAFLREHPDFSLLDAGEILKDRCKNLTFSDFYLQLRPDQHGTDGFFAAVLEKTVLTSPATAQLESPESEKI